MDPRSIPTAFSSIPIPVSGSSADWTTAGGRRRGLSGAEAPTNTLPRPVGVCPLSDGSKRTVYQDAAGRHFILDDDNRVISGDWLMPGAGTAAADENHDGGATLDGGVK